MSFRGCFYSSGCNCSNQYTTLYMFVSGKVTEVAEDSLIQVVTVNLNQITAEKTE